MAEKFKQRFMCKLKCRKRSQHNLIESGNVKCFANKTKIDKKKNPTENL